MIQKCVIITWFILVGFTMYQLKEDERNTNLTKECKKGNK